MEFYTVRQDEKKVLEINTGFHEIIYNATGSRFMAQVLRSYKEYIDQTRKALYYEPDYLDEILAEHRAILVAIKNRNVEEGKAAMSKHLDGSKRRAEFIYNVK